MIEGDGPLNIYLFVLGCSKIYCSSMPIGRTIVFFAPSVGSESPLHSAGDFLEARRLSREERARAYLQEARRNLPQQPAHICGGRCARACGHPENDDLCQFTCDVGHFYDASWLAVCRSPQVVPGDVVPGQGLAKKQETAKKQTIFFWGRPPPRSGELGRLLLTGRQRAPTNNYEVSSSTSEHIQDAKSFRERWKTHTRTTCFSEKNR